MHRCNGKALYATEHRVCSKCKPRCIVICESMKVLTGKRHMPSDLLRRRNRGVVVRHLCARGYARYGSRCSRSVGASYRCASGYVYVEAVVLIGLTRSGRDVSKFCCCRRVGADCGEGVVKVFAALSNMTFTVGKFSRSGCGLLHAEGCLEP